MAIYAIFIAILNLFACASCLGGEDISDMTYTVISFLQVGTVVEDHNEIVNIATMTNHSIGKITIDTEINGTIAKAIALLQTQSHNIGYNKRLADSYYGSGDPQGAPHPNEAGAMYLQHSQQEHANVEETLQMMNDDVDQMSSYFKHGRNTFDTGYADLKIGKNEIAEQVSAFESDAVAQHAAMERLLAEQEQILHKQEQLEAEQEQAVLSLKLAAAKMRATAVTRRRRRSSSTEEAVPACKTYSTHVENAGDVTDAAACTQRCKDVEGIDGSEWKGVSGAGKCDCQDSAVTGTEVTALCLDADYGAANELVLSPLTVLYVLFLWNVP